jgi:hypothetical protein
VAGCCWLSDLPDCFLDLNNDDPTVEIPQFDSENATHYTSGLVLPSSCLEPSWEPRGIRVCRGLSPTRDSGSVEETLIPNSSGYPAFWPLTKNRLSDNVGGVKHFWDALPRALRRVRHFALVEDVLFQPRLARNQFQVRNLSPTHNLFGRTTAIMITSADSPGKGSGTPNQLLGVRLHTMAISRLSRVSTRACGPRNFMKITQSRRQNGGGFGAARLISQWRS